MQNFIKWLIRPDGFVAKVACSFSLTLVFELLVGLASALFGGLCELGLAVFLPRVGARILFDAFVHVLQPGNLGLILLMAIAWQLAPLLLKLMQAVIVRVTGYARPSRRRVSVRPTPVTFDRTTLKERLRWNRSGDLGTSPA